MGSRSVDRLRTSVRVAALFPLFLVMLAGVVGPGASRAAAGADPVLIASLTVNGQTGAVTIANQDPIQLAITTNAAGGSPITVQVFAAPDCDPGSSAYSYEDAVSGSVTLLNLVRNEPDQSYQVIVSSNGSDIATNCVNVLLPVPPSPEPSPSPEEFALTSSLTVNGQSGVVTVPIGDQVDLAITTNAVDEFLLTYQIFSAPDCDPGSLAAEYPGMGNGPVPISSYTRTATDQSYQVVVTSSGMNARSNCVNVLLPASPSASPIPLTATLDIEGQFDQVPVTIGEFFPITITTNASGGFNTELRTFSAQGCSSSDLINLSYGSYPESTQTSAYIGRVAQLSYQVTVFADGMSAVTNCLNVIPQAASPSPSPVANAAVLTIDGETEQVALADQDVVPFQITLTGGPYDFYYLYSYASADCSGLSTPFPPPNRGNFANNGPVTGDVTYQAGLGSYRAEVFDATSSILSNCITVVAPPASPSPSPAANTVELAINGETDAVALADQEVAGFKVTLMGGPYSAYYVYGFGSDDCSGNPIEGLGNGDVSGPGPITGTFTYRTAVKSFQASLNIFGVGQSFESNCVTVTVPASASPSASASSSTSGRASVSPRSSASTRASASVRASNSGFPSIAPSSAASAEASASSEASTSARASAAASTSAEASASETASASPTSGTGTVDVILLIDIPSGLSVCVGSFCQDVPEATGAAAGGIGNAGGLATRSRSRLAAQAAPIVTFDDIPVGTYDVTVLIDGVVRYADAVVVTADTTSEVVIDDDDEVDPSAEPSASGEGSDAPSAGGSETPSADSSAGGASASARSSSPASAAPSAAASGSGTTGLPNTGAGSASGAGMAWLLAALLCIGAMVLMGGAIRRGRG